MPLFYAPEIQTDTKKTVIVGSEFNHLKNSLRKREGEIISLTNGKGLEVKGEIANVAKDHVSINIVSQIYLEKTKPHISLAFALLKKNNELIIEKCTELGIYEFYPFYSERSVKNSISSHQIERLHKVAISAMKQCDSVYLPKIHNPLTFSELLAVIYDKYDLILAWEEEHKTNLSNALKNTGQDICLVVGPEGGFEKAEVEKARELENQIVSLGNHILRAETAAITIVSQAIFFQLEKNPEYY